MDHSNITHVHIMMEEPISTCEFCEIPLISINHLILECPSLVEEKKVFPHPKNIEDMVNINYVNIISKNTIRKVDFKYF